MSRKKIKVAAGLIIVALLIGAAGYYFFRADQPTQQTNNSGSENQQKDQDRLTTTPTFDKTRYSIEDPGSLWVIVNKKRPLPADFVPADLTSAGTVMLRTEATQAVNELIKTAAENQINLKIISGYRSYSTQKNVYNSYVQKDGQAAADTYSARAGHSEHQTGLAADLGNSNGSCDLEICFSTTPGGKWLAEHAYEHGFIIRYTEEKTSLTGYQYEPWHIRHVGQDLAREIKNKNQTMEEFFGLPAALDY